MAFPVIISNSGLSIIVDGTPHVVPTSDQKYQLIVDALKAKDDQAIRDVFNPAARIEKNLAECEFPERLTIQKGVIHWDNEPVVNSLTDRILKMIDQGFSVCYLVNFMVKLMENPSYRAVTDLYTFLDKGSIPITEEGDFMAYKVLHKNTITLTKNEDGTVVPLTDQQIADGYLMNEDGLTAYRLLDCYTKKIVNNVGTVVKMPRNRVNDDPNQTCSHGLHACSREYIKSFMSSGNVLTLVRINPRDVVSIPTDYNSSKMRVCEYKVESLVDPEKATLGSLESKSVYR